MRWNLLLVVALILACACTPSPTPAPMPPDASDAAVRVDAAPPPSACFSACAILAAFCGPQRPTCVSALAEADRDRLVRAPDGLPMTCACIAGARSKAAVQACGAGCP